MAGRVPRKHEVNGILVLLHPPAPGIPAVPSMPELSTYEIVEDDDGTFTVTWAGTGRVVEMEGVAQRGLAIDRADDVADLLEALDRIAAERGGRMDG